MDLVTRFLRLPWGAFAFGVALAIASGFAVLALGMPPAALVPISLAGATLYVALKSSVHGRLDR